MFRRWLIEVALLWQIALRSAFRNPRRSILTLLAMSVGIVSANMLQALQFGVREQIMKDALGTFLGHAQVQHPEYVADPTVDHRLPALSERERALLSRAPISAWSQRVRVPGMITSEREALGVTILGLDPERERTLSFLSQAITSGRFLESSDDSGIVLGRRLAEFLETGLGKRVVLLSQDAEGRVSDRGFRVVGLFEADLEATEKTYVAVGLKTAQRMLKLENEINEVSVLLESEVDLPRVLAELTSVFPQARVRAWREIEPFLNALVKLQDGFLLLWYAIVILSIMVGLINTLFMAVFERTREFGLYLSLGMRPRGVLLSVIFESQILLFWGVIFGNLLTYALLFYLRAGINLSSFSEGAELVGFRSIVHPSLNLQGVVFFAVLVFVLGTLSSLIPAVRASKLLPVEALSQR